MTSAHGVLEPSLDWSKIGPWKPNAKQVAGYMSQMIISETVNPIIEMGFEPGESSSTKRISRQHRLHLPFERVTNRTAAAECRSCQDSFRSVRGYERGRKEGWKKGRVEDSGIAGVRGVAACQDREPTTAAPYCTIAYVTNQTQFTQIHQETDEIRLFSRYDTSPS